ncbi:hypothetical protein NC652_037479 [Populus alba x Populus x berolinensis]|nr:hypothetical protein NC652_037476 [Populus alba x Populus x berolinensis]KAJ6865963.1 hypothetical protein NC652_037479 [Populus alba x Populus x berolinensis]
MKTMENGAQVIKGFILSIPESVSRLWHGARQLESQQLPPPTMNQEEDLVDNSHDEQVKEWQKVLISTCFTSGLEITDSKRDSLHLVCSYMYCRIEESEVLLSGFIYVETADLMSIESCSPHSLVSFLEVEFLHVV